MSGNEVVIVKHDMVTSYGWGVDACWRGLLSGDSAISGVKRFCVSQFQADKAATISDIAASNHDSLVMQMIRPLFDKGTNEVIKDAMLILATTTGEIDLLERYVFTGEPKKNSSAPERLLAKIRDLTGTSDPGFIVSAACASSTIAIAQAAAMISSGECNSVLVVACDSVSEFVFAGFSTIMALAKNIARPFDKNRDGLTLGEAAGYVLLMSAEAAAKKNMPALAKVSGWGMSNDANHMTGPIRDGSGLAYAINKALWRGNIAPEDIGSISAHGTGTIYNDAMEMRAFKSVFAGTGFIPIYSVKGGTGHTMGAAGLVETCIATKSLYEKIIPNTVNLHVPDQEAEGWVLEKSSRMERAAVLSTNSGFGGINAAIVLRDNNE